MFVPPSAGTLADCPTFGITYPLTDQPDSARGLGGGGAELATSTLDLLAFAPFEKLYMYMYMCM